MENSQQDATKLDPDSDHKLNTYACKAKPLGEGTYATVYQATATDGKQYAVKVFFFERFAQKSEKAVEEARIERKAVEGLNHKHLVNLNKFCDKATMMMNDGDKKLCCYNVYDLMARGSLDDQITRKGHFNEEISRFYFRQLMLGMTYFHEKGYAHRDIKPGNLLFDSDYTLKLGDFGIATKMNPKEKDPKIKDEWGTEGFMAPECYEGYPFNGKDADLFSAAAVLFKMCTGCLAFKTTDPKRYDLGAQLLEKKKFDEFFKAKEKDGIPALSEDLKNLLSHLFAWDVKDRIKCVEVLDHKWFKGKTAHRHEVMSFMCKVKEKKTEESSHEVNNFEPYLWTKVLLVFYESDSKLFSNLVLDMLQKQGVAAKLGDNCMKFIIERKNPQGRMLLSCEVEIRIIEKEDIFHVELLRVAGSSQLFQEYLNDLKQIVKNHSLFYKLVDSEEAQIQMSCCPQF